MTGDTKELALRLGLSMAFLTLFAMVAYVISTGPIAPFDHLVRAGIHRGSSAALTMLSTGLSLAGSTIVLSTLFVIAMAVLIFLRRRRSAIALTLVMAGAVVLDNALKHAFHRVRPEPFFGTAPESFSFPSGHALFSTCLYVASAALFARYIAGGVQRAALWIGVGVLVAAIGLSRIYLGIHYPSDVVGGYLTAAFWLCAVWAAQPFLPADTTFV